MPAANFAFDGQQIFLTYPQCPLTRERIRDSLLEVAPLSKYYIARESHSDGNHHIHAYLNFGTRRRWTTASAFDVDGYHPNIQKPRSARAVIAYVGKEDAEVLHNLSEAELGGGTTDGNWRTVLESSTSRDDFLAQCRHLFPRDFVLSFERLEYFCGKHFGEVCESYSGRTRDAFREPDALSNWVNDNLTTGVERPKSLILIGASRLGKTEWARSLGTAMYFCGQFNLDDWNADASYIILDDFNFKFFPQWKSFLGCQKRFVLTDKYRKKRTVSWGKPCIVLGNDDDESNPCRALPRTSADWITVNCVFYFLGEKLYE
ncbi:replication-associated protein [Capybara virus 5_cap1_460]|nr:replication-associated protein [Capybara virus 5_cap1_460]